MSPSQAVHLVDDVLYGVYNHICIQDLVPLRLISKHWDATIRDHPHYWKTLDVRVATPSAIEFFLTRLPASHRRPVTVYAIFVDQQGSSPDQHRVVYDAIASHMDHIASLTLSSPARHSSDVFDVLRHAAPLLEALHWHIDLRPPFSNTRLAGSIQDLDIFVPLTLPPDLLSGFAPVLRNVTLRNVLLGPRRLPCLASATEVSITYDYRDYHEIPSIPVWFPRATILEIGGSVRTKKGEPVDVSSWNAIEHLTLHGEATRWYVNSLGGHGRHVTYCEWTSTVLDNVQQRLIGPLTLVVDATDLRWMQADFKSTVDGCTRSFKYVAGTWWNVLGIFYDMRNVFAYAPLMERVIFLVCSQPLLDQLAHLFASMTALETLVVTFDDFDSDPFAYFHDGAGVRDSTFQKAKLACPRLQRLVIRWDAAKLSGSQEDVARLIVQGLECSAFPSVTVEGLEAGRRVHFDGRVR